MFVCGGGREMTHCMYAARTLLRVNDIMHDKLLVCLTQFLTFVRLAQEVQVLLGGDYQGSSEGVSEHYHAFKTHSNVVPTA
jgi:hypothetical protein